MITFSSPEPVRPKVGIVAWVGRLWLCLAECLFREAAVNRGWVFGALLVAGLVAFEFFNFSTTEIALTDLLGGRVSWGCVSPRSWLSPSAPLTSPGWRGCSHPTPSQSGSRSGI